MGKRLTARVQKLNPVIRDQESWLSFGIVLEPESKELVLSRGNIYVLFDISSQSKLDTGLLQKIITDVLQSNYYAQDTSSPVQSLEKALSKVKDSISQLVQEGSLINTSVEFSSIGVILWGNVLYVVQYGKGHAFLMHNTDITTIENTGEGLFSSSSGLVKEDDVVILGTDSFVKKFPPKKLLTIAMSGKDLGAHDACLLLKLIEDTTFVDNTVTDISGVESVKKSRYETLLASLVDKVHLLGNVKTIKNDLVAAKPKINLKKSFKFGKRTAFAFGSLMVTLIVAFGVFNMLQYRNYLPKISLSSLLPKKPVPSAVTLSPEESNISESNAPLTTSVADDTSEDNENKVTRVTIDQTLYDLIITDLNVSPSDLEIYDNKLIVADSTSGKIYTSILGDYKFLPVSETFVGISNLVVNKDGMLTFGDATGLKVYDIKKLELKSQYTSSYSGGIGIFEDFIYTFDKSSLIKYSPSGTGVTANATLSPSTWGESESFLGAKSLQVAYSVYVVTSDNRLEKYTTGKKDKFEIKGLTVPFGDITDLYVREEFKHIYVVDKSNNRVVVLDLNGNFVKQFKYTNSSEWGALRSVVVSADEKTMYVLSGTKIYEISL